MTIADEICSLYEGPGSTAHPCGPLSHKDHALQAAALAESEGAPDVLVLAALLHDIGHLLDGIPENDVDGHHDRRGAKWLARSFGPDITEPIRLHVEAKRYLCAVDPNYLDDLSPDFVQRLKSQGGPLSRREIQDFQAEPYHRAALKLRRIDDSANEPNRTVPDLSHYYDRLENACLSHYLERNLSAHRGAANTSPSAP